MKHRLGRTWLIFTVAALVAGTMGCNQEESGTRNIVDVYSLNENGPLLSDVYDFGDNVQDPIDDFIPVDVVEVTFISRPHDPALTIQPGEPFGSTRFSKYRIEYLDDNPDGIDFDGDGEADLLNFEGAMNVYVPIGGFAQTYILVVSGGDKVVPPISCLGPIGGPGCSFLEDVEYGVNAKITFFGQEETSGEEIILERALTIRVGQFADN